MASVVGPIFVDYYVIRRGNYHVQSLYNRAKDSIYCFNSPVRNNWRGAAAFAGGIVSVCLCCEVEPTKDDRAETDVRLYSDRR